MTGIIFLGLKFNEDTLQKDLTESKSSVSLAAHVFQSTVIKGLRDASSYPVHVLSVQPVGCAPLNHKKWKIDSCLYEGGMQVGYINLPGIKQIELCIKIILKAKSIVKNNKYKNILIILYSAHFPFLMASYILKKMFDNVKLVLIQTDCVPGIGDMPEYMTFYRKMLGKALLRYIYIIDAFVVLTKYLERILNKHKKPYYIMECIADSEQRASIVKSESEDKIILYTGTTSLEYGLKELACAFKYIKSARLVICGSGTGDEKIKKLSEECNNVTFLGQISRAQIEKLRDQCDFLINPRRPTGGYTKYSFPSKTAEYLMSSKPVLAYKLEGIPDDYDEFINYLSAETPKQIAEELEYYLSMDYSLLQAKSNRAREYMLNNKTQYHQAKKMTQLFKTII